MLARARRRFAEPRFFRESARCAIPIAPADFRKCRGFALGIVPSDPQTGSVEGAEVGTPDTDFSVRAACGLRYAVTCEARDRWGNMSLAEGEIVVEDRTAPSGQLTVTPSSLGPPNHEMISISATLTISDNCDPAPTFTQPSNSVTTQDF
jgi:hypothetical protein